MGRFDLIGRHEDRYTAFLRLGQLIGVDLDASIRENVTVFDEARQALLNDNFTMQKLRNILADDIRFYEKFAG